MLLFDLYIIVSLLFGSAYAVSIERRLAKPNDDPFYTPPAGWESKQPGEILATRKILAASLGFLPTASVTSYQLLYRTQDQYANPLATATTIFVPLIHSKDTLVSFAVAEDSGVNSCAPSYQYRFGSDSSNLLAQAELVLIQIILSQGWIATVADYQGPNSAFSAGRLEGRAVLDSVRATLAFSTLRLAKDVKVGLWGYSGGGIAMGWASALQPQYAPELNIVGAAHGGTPTNLTATTEFLEGTSGAGFVAVALHGLSAAYPSFSARLDEVGTAAFRSVIDYVTEKCAVDVVLKYRDTRFFAPGVYFTNSDTILQDPPIRSVLDTLNLGEGGSAETPSVPLFIYHARNDQIIPYGPAERMVNNYCANGATVEFVTNNDNGVGHIFQEVLIIPRVIAFLRDRFSGQAASGCVRTNVGVASLVGMLSEAQSLGLGGLAPLLTAAVGVFQALPPI